VTLGGDASRRQLKFTNRRFRRTPIARNTPRHAADLIWNYYLVVGLLNYDPTRFDKTRRPTCQFFFGCWVYPSS
jgi:hypothetical protein